MKLRKRNIIKNLIFVGLIISLCGCSSENTELNPSTVEMETSENVVENHLTEEVIPSSEPSMDFTESRTKLPVNITDETITAEGEGIHLAKVFASTGDQLYFCQWAREGREAALYELEIGNSLLQEKDIEIPSDMDIYGMACGTSGNLYFLMRTSLTASENVISVIREVDREGNILQDLAISDGLQKKLPILQAFIIDNDGNYYIRGMTSTMYISGEGAVLWETKDSDLGISNSYAATMDADGDIYIAYQKNQNTYIGTLNLQDGTIAKEYFLEALESRDQILAIGPGTDSNLLLYGSISGIWAWNKENNELEDRNVLSEADIAYNEYVVIRAFLEDGRLLLVENVSEAGELTGRIYKYIPAGR